MLAVKRLNYFDFSIETERFRNDVLNGLTAIKKKLPPKYFYDQVGSELFEQICQLPEYYLTRTELDILKRNMGEIAATLPPELTLIEYGSGSSQKTRLLLDFLKGVKTYVPIDIARDFLLSSAEKISEVYPSVVVTPICADFTYGFSLPPSVKERTEKRVFFFPGSTIGNLLPHEAENLLRMTAEIAGPGGGLLIGVDLQKDPKELEEAYNDTLGVTAAFNLNVLVRINRELRGRFDLDNFEHYAFFNQTEGRVEMHLRSLKAQTVFIDNVAIGFEEGETIHTENSYKYSIPGLESLAFRVGFELKKTWTDPLARFSVHYLTAQ